VSEGIRALRHHPQAHADDGLSAKAAAQLGPAAFRAMHERLLHAYFAENRDITKGETLQPLWAETGLPPTSSRGSATKHSCARSSRSTTKRSRSA